MTTREAPTVDHGEAGHARPSGARAAVTPARGRAGLHDGEGRGEVDGLRGGADARGCGSVMGQIERRRRGDRCDDDDHSGLDRDRAERGATGRHRRAGARRRGAGSGGGAARAGPTELGESELDQQDLLEQDDRADRQECRERAVVRAQLRLEAAAAIAVLDVAAHRRRQRADPLGARAEFAANLLAGQLARLSGLGETDPRAHQQRLHARDGRLHRVGDLLVGERVHLAQDKRRALGLRQPRDVVEQQAELLAAVGLVAGRDAAVSDVHVHRVDPDRGGATQVVERAVASDAIEPGPHVDLAVVRDHRVERCGKDLLKDILGVLA